jgi:hypothetical protein
MVARRTARAALVRDCSEPGKCMVVMVSLSKCDDSECDNTYII